MSLYISLQHLKVAQHLPNAYVLKIHVIVLDVS